MACAAACAYRQKNYSIELFGVLAKTTSDHACFAITINALAALIFDKSEFSASVLQGFVTAFVLNGSHFLADQIMGEKKSPHQEVVKFALLFFGSVYFFPNIAARFNQEVTFYQSLRYGILSCFGIYGYNRLKSVGVESGL